MQTVYHSICSRVLKKNRIEIRESWHYFVLTIFTVYHSVYEKSRTSQFFHFRHVLLFVCFLWRSILADTDHLAILFGFPRLWTSCTGNRRPKRPGNTRTSLGGVFGMVFLKELDDGFIHVLWGLLSIWPISSSCGSQNMLTYEYVYVHIYIFTYLFTHMICFLVMRGREGSSTDSSPHSLAQLICKWFAEVEWRGPKFLPNFWIRSSVEDDLLRMAYLNAPWWNVRCVSAKVGCGYLLVQFMIP